MLERLDIQNFQSHTHSVIDFAPTVTAIVGANNHGKSAIIRALQKVIRDVPLGTTFVHDESTECLITLESNGHTVVRAVRLGGVSNNNEYVVDGIAFNKFGASGIPEEVLTALGITEVQEFGDVLIDLNFQHQLDDPFLVKGSGLPSLRGKVLGRVTGVDKAQRAVQIANGEFKSHQGDADKLRKDINTLQADIASLQYVDALKTDVESLEELYNVYLLGGKTLEVLRQKRSKVASIVAKAKACVSLLKVTENDFEDSLERFQEQQVVVKRLSRLLHLSTRIGQLEELHNLEEPSLEDMEWKLSVLSHLKRLQVVKNRILKMQDSLNTTDVPSLESIVVLQNQLVALQNSSESLSQLGARITQLTEEESELGKQEVSTHVEIHALEEELGVCPLCNNPFDRSK